MPKPGSRSNPGMIPRSIPFPRGLDALCLIAGALLPLAFAPWRWYFLAWVGLIPLLLATEDPNGWRRFRRGFLFGVGLFGVGLHWLLPTITTFGQMPLPLAIPTWLLLAAYCALYPALFALVGGWLGGPPALRFGLALPLLWGGLEMLRGVAFTGFPWLSLGDSQMAGPMTGWLAAVGRSGTGVLLAGINGGLILVLRAAARKRAGRGLLAAVGVAGLIAAGVALGAYSWTQPAGPALEAALVQGSVPQRLKWDPDQRATILARYRRLTRHSLDADLVIWPESALPVFTDQARAYLDRLDRAARERGTALLAGAPERSRQGDRTRHFNSVLGLGTARGRYRKRHLVPFGEYVPLRSVLFFAERFVPGGGRFVPGSSTKPLRLNGTTAGISICYEDAFSRETAATVRKGAGLLINVTNDAWFGRTIGPAQHAQLARARARELGRPMLRVANTGLTFAADHRGRTMASIPPDEPGVARVRIRPRTGATPYQALSAGWIPGIVGMALIAVAAATWRGPRIRLPGRRR